MKRSEVVEFINKNIPVYDLTYETEDKYFPSGIYAITVEDRIVYVGQSKNIFQRMENHILNMMNHWIIE